MQQKNEHDFREKYRPRVPPVLRLPAISDKSTVFRYCEENRLTLRCRFEMIISPATPVKETKMKNGYDYENQAWVVDGKYVRCGHPETMKCGCYGRKHEGEIATAEAK